MAWEWGYTNETHDYAREQLDNIKMFGRAALVEMAQEWKDEINEVAQKAWDNADWMRDEEDEPLEPFVAPCQFDVENAGDGALRDFIWEGASSWEIGRLCSNGGHEIYLCPHGCHTVSLRDMPEDWSPEEY